MNAPPLISPKLRPALARYFPDVCLIQMIEPGALDQDPYGAPHGVAQRPYITRPGHQGIPCGVSFEYNGSPRSAKEVRQVQYTMEWNTFHILLNGYFPSIIQTDQAVVAGITYEVQGVISDFLRIFTHLHCRILNV